MNVNQIVLELIDNATIVRYTEVVEDKPRPVPGFLPGEKYDDYMKLTAAVMKKHAQEMSDEAMPDETRDRIVELAEKIESGKVNDLLGAAPTHEKRVSFRPKAVACVTDEDIAKAINDARAQLKKYRESGAEKHMGPGIYATAAPPHPSDYLY